MKTSRPAAKLEAELEAKIASSLPLLEQRVRKRELHEVVTEALARQVATASGFLQLFSYYAAESVARRVELEELRTAYARARSPAEQAALIARALAKEQAPRRAFRALRRGWLDIDAMAERAELRLHELEVRQSLALRAAAALAEEAEKQEVFEFLIELLLAKSSPLCAVACAEGLADLLGRLPSLLEQDVRIERLCAMLLQTEPTRPRRVLSAQARLCLQVAPRLALRYAALLLYRAAPGDDFLMRQHLVVLLGQRRGDLAAFEVLVAAAQRPDPSEHVRVALPAALCATGGTAAAPLLIALSAGPLGDKSPRVRAAAVVALAELLRSQQAQVSGALERLVEDSDFLVYTIVCEEIASLATLGVLGIKEAAGLRAALQRRLAQAESPRLAEPALRALEALALITDPSLDVARSLLVERLRLMRPGEVLELQVPLEPLVFGRLLAQLAPTSFGFSAQAIRGGYRIECGPRFVVRAWRLLHELRRRTPYKRQDALHVLGREYRGALRAPSAVLAEATSTAVPGEPLALPSDEACGPHMPTVDDLLSTALFHPQQVLLFSARGLTRIYPPRGLLARLHARMTLSTKYAALADLRLRSLDPADPSERTRYVEALEALGFNITLEPHAAAGNDTSMLAPTAAAPFGNRVRAVAKRAHKRVPATPSQGQLARRPPPGRLLAAVSEENMLSLSAMAAPFTYNLSPDLKAQTLALLPSTHALFGSFQSLLSPVGASLEQLAVAVGMISLAMLLGNVRQYQRIRQDRAAIPLVIGGWGTRGKSGTERLKAAMLHALDLNVLVKTTGCEAMFIHGVPGRKPTEIFIHRCYDKATIWEQRDLLRLAARLQVSVFLWECMALSAPLVRVLAAEWMQDDLQTLTNAYPDHEDIQGPAGHDVARSIAAFIRSRGNTITTEEQMLPILAEEAKRKGARLIAVSSQEHLLLADDLLARFPYREHPRNIALVRRLAVELGLDPDLATADMADHVVPDLGVLKAYPLARYRSRGIIFVNGMSANERTGFLSNWERTGCERPVEEAEKTARWVVTVTNNRFDRVARSKAFAEILVRDASAERHVLIGTNLSGLRVYIHESLTRFLPELRLFHDEDAAAQLPELLAARCQRLRHRLRIGPAEPQAFLRELSGWLGGREVGELCADVTSAFAAATALADAGEPLAAIRKQLLEQPLAQKLSALLPGLQEELVSYANRSLARRALLASLEQQAERALHEPAARPALLERQDRLYRELFLELVVAVEDPGASGDQIIDTIASACPPGIEATVMGIQNIKGTGLDFVYRFIRYDEVHGLAEALKKAEGSEARTLSAALLARSDFGMLDSALAVNAVQAAAMRLAVDATTADYLTHAGARLTEISQRCQAALRSGTKQRKNPLRRFVEKTLDTFDSARRRWRAEAILDALVHREISHERAALEMRRLVDREKKGWLSQ